MLDYRLYTFLTLSETLNYTKAAEILCITQPAVSQHIRYLETTYQIKLFDHHGKNLILTKQGEYLASCLRTMNADEKRVVENLRNIKDISRIKFGATLTIGEYFLPERIQKFLQTHPHTNLTMQVENTATLLQMLDHGEISFAFLEGYFPLHRYEHQTLSRQPYVALKGKDYQMKKPVHTLQDLFNETLIIREEGSGTREVLERVLKERNLTIQDFSNTIEIGNMNAIKHLVEKNSGITFLYKAAVEEQLKKGTMEVIPLKDFDIQRDFTFITLKKTIFMEEYKEFLSCILESE